MTKDEKLNQIFLRPKDIRERYGCSTEWLRQQRKKGNLIPYCWVGRYPRYTAEQIEELLGIKEAQNGD